MNGGLNQVGTKAAPAQGRDAAAPTSLEDAFNGYLLVLGRHPASIEEVTRATGCTLGEFPGHYLMRSEFLTGIVAGLTGTAVLPHVALAPAPDEALRCWALKRLPLSAAALELAPTRRLIGEASHTGAGTIMGWCANANDASECVVLELHLGERFIGAVRCEHGFAFDIPVAHADLVLPEKICSFDAFEPLEVLGGADHGGMGSG